MAEFHLLLIKLLKVCFFLVSLLVPYLSTMTTNNVLLTDTSTTPKDRWSSVRSPIGSYRMVDSNYTSVTSVNKKGDYNPPLIKLRRVSLNRNSRRKIDTFLTPPNIPFVETNFHGNQQQSESSSIQSPHQSPAQVAHTEQGDQNNGQQQQNYNQNIMNPEIKSPMKYLAPPNFIRNNNLAIHHPPYHYGQIEHEEPEEYEEELPEVEDKVFTKSIVATKALTIGKIIFSFFLVVVVIILAILSSLGANLAPIVLPLALIPVGIIALLLFIPLFFAFVPLVVAGVAEGKKRRKRRFIDHVDNGMIQSLESRITQVLDHWPAFLLSLTIQKYKNFNGN